MANETITGKIFTLKDPTGTYNRFPRTVMEAVYGLNTYLQNQFSSLADIYMPIEGITESKPLQEFVYRLCPSSIKSKSVSLDRIYGKTLAWNQTLNKSEYAATETVAGITFTNNSDGSISVTGTNDGSAVAAHLIKTSFSLVVGHKYYLRSENSRSSGGCFLQLYTVQYNISDFENPIFTYGGETISFVRIRVNNSYAISGTMKYWPELIDLTLLYGSAIDGMTDAEILAKFESEFPGYHSYEAGKLISNDAESIETVGFNQWDEEYEVGIYEIVNGTKTSGSQFYRTVNFVPVLPSTEYYYKAANTNTRVLFYGANHDYIGSDNTIKNSVFTTPAGCYYITFFWLIEGSAGSPCINLSDTAKNGTYEPYRKSTMQLGLGSFQVRDSQGNVTTITGGLKSAGSVYDEIVGNKYIKRVGEVDLGSLNYTKNGVRFGSTSVVPGIKTTTGWSGVFNSLCASLTYEPGGIGSESAVGEYSFHYGLVYISSNAEDTTTFKAAMNGVMLNYELATPIEYELVSPLVPTVKAGETEARISPNSDGLSAPMVADMTYDAQANNDSASAQYALTAGRLLNSHKLWGQDFDGTQDVSGNLVSNGTLTGTQLISTVATGTAPLTVASTTEVANLHAYTATKLHTARTLWGNSFDGTANVNSYLQFPNGDLIYAKDSGGTTRYVMGLTDSLSLGYGTASASIDTMLYGNNIRLYYGTSRTVGMILNSSGNVGIGATNPGAKLDVRGSSASIIRLVREATNSAACIDLCGNNQTTNYWRIIADDPASANFSIAKYIGSTESKYFTITGNGNVGIGNPSPSYKLDVSDTFRATGAATFGSTIHADGGIDSNSYITAGAVNSSSDSRLKNNITSVVDAMETIMALKPSEWIWNEKHFLNGQKGAGLVAQDVMGVLPFAVAKEGDYLALNYNVFHAYEIAGLQDHEERIKALEAENAELRRRLGA